MTLNHRGVIFAFLLLIFATNFKETETEKSEETMGYDDSSSTEDSGSGKMDDKDEDVGSGNKTASSSQDEGGTESDETMGHSEIAKNIEEKSSEPPPPEIVASSTDVEETAHNETSLDVTENENTTLIHKWNATKPSESRAKSDNGKNDKNNTKDYHPGKGCGNGKADGGPGRGNPDHSDKKGCPHHTQPPTEERPTNDDDDVNVTQSTLGPTSDGDVIQPTVEPTTDEDDATQPTTGPTSDDADVTSPTKAPRNNSDSTQPTNAPTNDDTDDDDYRGSIQPTVEPTTDDDDATQPTNAPTNPPTTPPTNAPTNVPTNDDTDEDDDDSGSGSIQPTVEPTTDDDDATQPTNAPTNDDTDDDDDYRGSIQPTVEPTSDDEDVTQSTNAPTNEPMRGPSGNDEVADCPPIMTGRKKRSIPCSTAIVPNIKSESVIPATIKAPTTGSTTKTSTTGSTTQLSTARSTTKASTTGSTTETAEASTTKLSTTGSTTGPTTGSTTQVSTTETAKASTTGSTTRESVAEKAKETLREKAKHIDATNKTQMQTVLASFKKILSDDESTEPTKLKDDLVAVKLLENVGKTIASQLNPTQMMPASVGEISDDQVFGVVAMSGMNKSGFSFPEMIGGLRHASSFPAKINLPSAVLNNNTSSNLSLVFMIYTASSEMQSRTGNESFNVTGKVVLASMFPKPTHPFQEPVVITIQNPPVHTNSSSLTSVCVFLMENSSNQNASRFGAWSDQGCKLAYRNKSHSVCHCYHFTNFAILTRFSAQKIPKEHELALSIITYIGLSLSIFGCLATLFVHFMLPKLWTDRTFIHMNLVTALGIANIIFLFQKIPVVGSAGCTALALILLYFYLAAFSWMLLEGIHIYRMLVKVFESGKDPRKQYFAAGWGLPMLLVVIAVSIFREDVTSEYYCWLSATNGALWLFAGPVCLVIFVNTVMLLVVMRTSLHHHSKQDKRLKRSMAKTFCVLLPVLGITWLIGLVTFNKDIIELQYIFAIVNSLQGFFIFLFYVVFSQEVRREITHKLQIWKTEKEIYDQAQMVTRESKLRYSEQTNSLPHIKP